MIEIPNITETISSIDLIELYEKIRKHDDDESFIQEYTLINKSKYTFNVSDIFYKDTHPDFRILSYTNEDGKESYFVWIRGSNLTSFKDARISNKNKPFENAISGYDIHGGYFNAAKTIVEKIKLEIKIDECKELIFFGHSIGGAVSAICAAILHFEENKENVRAFTFGTPPKFFL